VPSHESYSQSIRGADLQFALDSTLVLLEIELVVANASAGWRLEEVFQPVDKRHLDGGVVGNDTYLSSVQTRRFFVELSS